MAAGETVQEDFSISVELGAGLEGDEALHAALDERLPRESPGLIRTEEGLPAELILLSDEAEVTALAEAGNTYPSQEGRVARYGVERVVRERAEFLATRNGIHWAITVYRRGNQSSAETPTIDGLEPEA